MPNVGPIAFKDIDDQIIPRISSGISEFDRVLGGGRIMKKVVLVGGDPGIGKSTLMLQVSNNLSKIEPVLYISGEESVKQTKLRADRLGNMQENLYIASDFSSGPCNKRGGIGGAEDSRAHGRYGALF